VNLTVICPHFAPDGAPTGHVMTSLVEEWVEQGHRVHVVTAKPWYTHHRVEEGWGRGLVQAEARPWGRITRVHPFPTDKRNIPARALAFFGFTLLAGLVAIVRRPRPDVVVAMSPPLTLGLAGWAVGALRRAPFVFNIQDVFPDVAVEAGVLTNPLVVRVAAAIERFCYRRAAAVTVLSEDLRENVAAKLPEEQRDKVAVIPNFIDTGSVAPQPRENEYRREHGLTGSRVVMYAGNLGFSQPVELLLDAARELADQADLRFVVNGGGAARPALERAARDLRNVRFVDLQPRERLSEVLAAADLHIVLLRPGLARSSVPSKLYSILAAARPIVASVDEGSEVARTVQGAGAGLAVPAGDGGALAKAICAVLADPDEAARMGQRGRSFVEGWPSPAGVAAEYLELLGRVTGERPTRSDPGRSVA